MSNASLDPIKSLKPHTHVAQGKNAVESMDLLRFVPAVPRTRIDPVRTQQPDVVVVAQGSVRDASEARHR